MALFGSGGKQKKRRAGGTTIVAAGTTFAGELYPEGNLHIDGRLEGQIDSSSDVSVGADGSFEGEIRAHRMVVSGFVRGRIECDSLEIVDNGRVLGEVASRRFVIEPGGQFVGESRSTDEESVAQLSHWREGVASSRPAARGDSEAAAVEPAAAVDTAPEPDPLPDVEPDLGGEEEPLFASLDDAAGDGAGLESHHDDHEPTIPVDRDEPDSGRGWATQNDRRWR